MPTAEATKARAPKGRRPDDQDAGALSRHSQGANSLDTHGVDRTAHATILGPYLDSMLIGGASIIACLLYWLFVPSTPVSDNMIWLAFYASFVVNFPHFAASYQLLYGEYRHQIFRKKSYFWAAVASPALIVAVIFAGVQAGNANVLAFMIQGMYLSVGWHYVKQIYGTAIVTSAIQKRYFGKWERIFILLNLNAVWAMSWVNANQSRERAEMNGVSYFLLGLPASWLSISYWAVGLTFIAAASIMLRKYIKTGVRPATSSLVAYAAIYCWYLPTLYHPTFFYLIPFFHSLQYLLFVGALRKNQADEAFQRQGKPEAQRLAFVRVLWGFYVLAAILGAAAFEWVPRALDRASPISGFATPFLWYFCFNIFINLHHYFIDNVIWRGDNELLKVSLVQASQKKAAV